MTEQTPEPTVEKYLFLDIDGVLNSTRSVVSINPNDTALWLHRNLKHREIEIKRLDPVALGLIRNLCAETNTEIVLSSSWRIGLGSVIELATTLDLPIVSTTPILGGDRCRGDEIELWLDIRSTDNPRKYAIVDDDSDMLPEQMPFFVKTNHNNGLLYEDYELLLDLLK